MMPSHILLCSMSVPVASAEATELSRAAFTSASTSWRTASAERSSSPSPRRMASRVCRSRSRMEMRPLLPSPRLTTASIAFTRSGFGAICWESAMLLRIWPRMALKRALATSSLGRVLIWATSRSRPTSSLTWSCSERATSSPFRSLSMISSIAVSKASPWAWASLEMPILTLNCASAASASAIVENTSRALERASSAVPSSAALRRRSPVRSLMSLIWRERSSIAACAFALSTSPCVATRRSRSNWRASTRSSSPVTWARSRTVCTSLKRAASAVERIAACESSIASSTTGILRSTR